MQYIKHYWVNCSSDCYCCEENPVEKRHPEVEYPGLDVKIWAHDSDGIDVCLSEVPDGVTIEDIIDEHSGKKVVQKLTVYKFSSIKNLFDSANSLYFESREAEFSGDQDLANAKKAEADAKFAEANSELHAL